MLSGLYLQLSQSIVTLLLTWGLLSAHGDELVDAVCNRPVDTDKDVKVRKEVRKQKSKTEDTFSPSGSCQLVLQVGGAGISG